MEIGEESEPVEVPLPLHPDQVPAEPEPLPALPEPEKVPA